MEFRLSWIATAQMIEQREFAQALIVALFLASRLKPIYLQTNNQEPEIP